MSCYLKLLMFGAFSVASFASLALAYLALPFCFGAGVAYALIIFPPYAAFIKPKLKPQKARNIKDLEDGEARYG